MTEASMKILTRVYDTYAEAREVVADLEANGIGAADINLIANRYVCEETVRIDQASAAGPGASAGAALGATAGLMAGLGVIAIPGLGPVVAAGALASTAAVAAAGAVTGGLVGALVKAGVPGREAEVHCDAVRRGGTMVSVRVSDERSAYVQQIVDRHAPIDPGERRAVHASGPYAR